MLARHAASGRLSGIVDGIDPSDDSRTDLHLQVHFSVNQREGKNLSTEQVRRAARMVVELSRRIDPAPDTLQRSNFSGVEPMRQSYRLLVLAAGCALGACTGDTADPPVQPPGADETPRTRVLEAGAKLIQTDGPAGQMDIYIVGFHPMKDAPDQQMEAHHYCRQVNEDFAQCSLFDGNAADANLTGIDYIISERIFETLPAEERAFWHPHNGEILSGQLVAPGLPEAAERELMRSKLNSYGKTWHTWHTRHGTRPGDSMPFGPPVLAWSFNRDGEVDPALVAARDARLDIETARIREDRQSLREGARPQYGVDALRAHFSDAVPIPGVVDAERATEARP